MLEIDFNNPYVLSDMEEIERRLVQENHELIHKNIYISGATGMIASYLVAYLVWLNQKYEADIQLSLNVRSRNKAEQRFGKFIDMKEVHLIVQDVNDFPISEANFDYNGIFNTLMEVLCL